MKTKYFFLTEDESKNATNKGWAYIKAHENRLVENNEFTCIATGYNKGSDFCVYNGKAYTVFKTYADIENNVWIVLCLESTAGCDVI